MTKVELLGVSLSITSYQKAIADIITLAKAKTSSYVCITNVHMVIEAYKNKSFKKVVNAAHIATTDGKPLTWCLSWLYGIRQSRIAGMFLMQDVIVKAEQEGIPVFFYGSTESVLQTAKDFLHKDYPGLNISGMMSPPFRSMTEAEEKKHIEMINNSGAQIVFVSLGCPKQEKWMASMKGKINAVMIGVGAALPVLAGVRRKAPLWIQNSGFEWLFRLCLEPRRLFRRYATTNSLFIYLMLKEVINARVVNKKAYSAPWATMAYEQLAEAPSYHSANIFHKNSEEVYSNV